MSGVNSFLSDVIDMSFKNIETKFVNISLFLIFIHVLNSLTTFETDYIICSKKYNKGFYKDFRCYAS